VEFIEHIILRAAGPRGPEAGRSMNVQLPVDGGTPIGTDPKSDWLGPLVAGPLQRPQIWMSLAWSDVVQSYRRTVLGPFWITMNLVIFAVAMTLILGSVFKISTEEYAGFVLCGMIAWMWISTMLTDVGNTFLVYSQFLRSIPIDKSHFVWAAVAKQGIVLGHQLIVYAGMVLVGLVHPTVYTLLAIPAFALLFVMSIPFAAGASILFARYRDLPRLVSGSIIIVMMMTPIFWKPDMISGWRSAFVYLNPVYYVIDLIRSPLLGEPLSWLTVVVTLGLTLVLWVVGASFYSRYQRYVVFWV
jgi:ABC-type polysaccharide/polyol phosphate export permease